MKKQLSIGIYLTSMTIGGAERVALDLARGFSRLGHDVDLILVEASGGLLEQVPRNVRTVDLEADRVAASLLPLRRYMNRKELDVLYSMMTEPNLIAIAARMLSTSSTKLVISEHNILSHEIDSVKDRIISLGAWGFYPLTDHAVAVSKGVYDDLIARTRLSEDQASVIYNPVDVQSIRERAAEPVDHEWLIDSSLNVVLAGGRHEPQKGFDTLLGAFARLEKEETRLILFGEGAETDNLKEQAKFLGILDRISFVGFVENPFSYMAASDVFVLSSRREGFGLVLIEAMACGCPVVSTNCESGPAEILENGRYGPLVPVGDEEALSKEIRKSLKIDHERERLYQRATDFGSDIAVKKYQSLFKQIIS